MDHFQVVWSEEEIKKYYDVIMKKYIQNYNVSYLLIALARQKYNPNLITKSQCLGRRIFSGDGDLLVGSVTKFEYPIKAAQIGMTLIDSIDHIDKVSTLKLASAREVKFLLTDMSMYITIFPSSNGKALMAMTKNYVDDLLSDESKIDSKVPSHICKNVKISIESLMADQLAKHPFKLPYMDADVDVDFTEFLEKDTSHSTRMTKVNLGNDKRIILHSFLDEKDLYKSIELTIKTRGGYHILFNIEKLGEQTQELYKFKKTAINEEFKNKHDNSKFWFNLDSKSQVPLPGTYQGGFKVRIVDLREELLSIVNNVTK